MHLAIAFSVRRPQPALFVKIAALAAMLPIASAAMAQITPYIPSSTNAYTQSLVTLTASGANTPYFPSPYSTYTDFSTLEAVNADGTSPFFNSHDSSAPITVMGIVLNNPADMLDSTARYNTNTNDLGGQWQIFIQAYSDTNTTKKVGGDPADYGGAEFWVGQCYGNLFFIGEPGNSTTTPQGDCYTDSQWNDVVANLNNPPLITGGTVALKAGDVVAVTSLGLEYDGMVNLNQQHYIGNPISLTVLEQGVTLPTPTETTLSQLQNASGVFYFDPSRKTGAEHLQGTLVQMDGVRVLSGTWAPGNDVIITDGSLRQMELQIGVNSNLTVAPTGAFNVIGIEDQEAPPGTYTGGYTLWLTDSANVTPLPGGGTFNWTGSGTSWNAAGSWNLSGKPQNPGDVATFGGSLAAAATVTLDGPQEAGVVILVNSNTAAAGYTLSPGVGGTLTLDNSGAAALVTVMSGTHAIAAPLILDDNLVASVASSAGLTICGGISQASPGLSLTVQGGGLLVLGGTNHFTGGTTVSDGTLIVEDAAALAGGTDVTVGNATGEFTNVIGAGVSPTAAPLATVPEPGTLALSAGALGCFLLSYRARRRKSRD